MPGNKQLRRLQEFFSVKKRKQAKKLENLKKILAKLKKHREKLNLELDTESDPKRIKKLKSQIQTIHLKCKKGRKLLTSIESETP